MKREDMLGKRFGRQTVVGLPPEKDKVIVQCDCGRIHTVRADTITREKSPVQSCGCFRRERAAEVGADVVKKYESHKPSKRSTTGVKGVAEKKGGYVATICVRYRQIYLGRYKKLEDARLAREYAEEIYYKPIIEEAYEREHEHKHI